MGDLAVTVADQMFHRIIGAFVVIDHYAGRIDLFTDAIEEHDGYAVAGEGAEMIELAGLAGHGNDDAFHAAGEQHLCIGYLGAYRLLGLTDNYIISRLACYLLGA